MDWKVVLVLFIWANGLNATTDIYPIDLVLLLDSSDSFRSNNFEVEERFATSLIQDIFSHENRFGLFTFGRNAYNQFQLNSYSDKQEIVEAVKYMWYSTGDGSVASAINFTVTNGFTSTSGDRECVTNLLIILSHSEIANISTAIQLRNLMASKSVKAFVLNMAGASSEPTFRVMTNDNSTVINIPSFADLDSSIQGILHQIRSALGNTGCGKLTAWQPWTRCSVTCGSGLRFRVRECRKEKDSDTDCVGDLTEDILCTKQECTELVDGRWANWNSWSVCSKTCGKGIQTRVRACAAPMPLHGGKPCPGGNKQQRECSDWKCPDCGKSCPSGGHLSKNCQICECSSVTLFGRVAGDTNVPVENANVYLESRRYKPIVKTDAMGLFKVSGICLMNEEVYIDAKLHASKHIPPTQVNSTHWTINGTLEKYIQPVFVVHPHDKSRMVGQSFSLCCSAVGKPTPTHYKWLKDEIELENEGTNGTLTINSATKAEAASYKCVTETLAGVSQSDEAHVTVAEFADDTCGSPKSNLKQLPAGCFLSGDATKNNSIDVGTCGQTMCMTSSLKDNGTCSDWWPHYCCDSNDIEELIITCNGFSYKATRVKSCECKLCRFKTTVSGRAVGRNNSKDVPFQLGSIFVGGKELAKTNMAGFFKFPVPKGTKRVVATFHDQRFKRFMDITKIILITEGSDVYTSVIVPLKPDPIPFNSSDTTEILLGGGDKLQHVASLSIQNHSLLTSDGHIYRGEARATVHFMDPRDINSLDAANGEFESETPGGDKVPLRTFGMFQLGLHDTNGNELQIHKPLGFSLDSSHFDIPLDKNGDPDLALWDYDTNKGIWIENTKLRFSNSVGGRRRLLESSSLLVATILPNNIPELVLNKSHIEERFTGRYTNCDHSIKIYENVTLTDPFPKDGLCYVSVSVFTDMTLSEPIVPNEKTITISAYTQEIDGSSFLGKTKQNNPKNGHACMVVFCDKIVYLKVETDGGEKLVTAKHHLPVSPPYPVNNTKYQVQFVSKDFGAALDCPIPPCAGPMYQYRNSAGCRNAHDSSYRFNFAFFTKPPQMTYTTGSMNDYDKKLSWYPVSPEKATFRSCFLKILIKIHDTYDLRLVATSHLRNFGGEQFGTHNVGPTPNPKQSDNSVRGACLEFRCPGYIKDGSNEIYDATTAVEMHMTTHNSSLTCSMKILNDGLKPEMSPVINSTSGSTTGLNFLSKAGVNYGSSYGVFIDDAHRSDVENFCKSGRDSGQHIEGYMDPVKNPAVEFDCRS